MWDEIQTIVKENPVFKYTSITTCKFIVSTATSKEFDQADPCTSSGRFVIKRNLRIYIKQIIRNAYWMQSARRTSNKYEFMPLISVVIVYNWCDK